MSAPAERRLARLLWLPLGGLAESLLPWPAGWFVQESLRTASSGGSLTLTRCAGVALEPRWVRALFWSFALGAAAAQLSTTLCLALAWLLAHGRFRGRSLLRGVYALPLSLSGVLVGCCAAVLLGRVGLAPGLARRLGAATWLAAALSQLGAVVLASLCFEFPRGALALEAALRRFALRRTAASRSLGASRWQAWAYVVPPALWPALLAALSVLFSAPLACRAGRAERRMDPALGVRASRSARRSAACGAGRAVRP